MLKKKKFPCRLYIIVRLMFVFAIFFTFGLQFYVPVSILWPPIRRRIRNEKYHDLGEYVFRTFLVLVAGKSAVPRKNAVSTNIKLCRYFKLNIKFLANPLLWLKDVLCLLW